MKKILPLLILIAVVAFSGCVNQPITPPIACKGAGATDGITITDFSFDYAPNAGESTGLTLETTNIGGETGMLLGVDVFGPEINIGEATDFKWGASESLTQTLNEELEAPDPEISMSGGSWPKVWTLTAPKSLVTDTEYTFNARVKYRYTTTFTAVLTIMKSEYLRSLSSDDRKNLIESGGLSQQCSSGGPLSVTGTSSTHFVDPSGEKTIRFKIDNVGNGYPYCVSSEDDCGNTLDPGTTMYHVKVKSPEGGYLTNCESDKILSKGKSVVFSCKFNAPEFTNKLDITFSIPITYDYYIDSSAPVTVKKSLK
jgi:hypothetical protein